MQHHAKVVTRFTAESNSSSDLGLLLSIAPRSNRDFMFTRETIVSVFGTNFRIFVARSKKHKGKSLPRFSFKCCGAAGLLSFTTGFSSLPRSEPNRTGLANVLLRPGRGFALD
ncbi:hypothetical protein NL676_009416 [Syzygium grande]|nr:hypothetical protein NL676_009416 [Syzygium grande]